MVLNCYNCAKKYFPEDVTKEHIPSKCLFEGTTVNEKENRITVNACKVCNQEYAKTSDEEFRNYLAIIANENTKIEFIQKADRAFIRNFEKVINKISYLHDGIYISIDFNFIRKQHYKDFKGVFYHLNGIPFPENDYILSVVTEKDEMVKNFYELNCNMINFLKNFDWRISGSEEIFRYKLWKINPKDLPFRWPYKNSFLCLMDYLKNHIAIVYAIDKNELT